MLEARNVRKVYKSGGSDLAVLQGVTVRIAPGDFLAVTGPSGAGKSTLLHLLAGLDSPTSGDVCWEGRPLSRMSETERAAFRNRAIGIVFQFYHLLPELTALENVMLPALVLGGSSTATVRDRARQWLGRVGLSGRVHHRPRALSGGELQRAAIARALMNEPKVLLCDEPTGNLDSKTGTEIAELLAGLQRQQGVSLVLVTHETMLAGLADRMVILRDGRIVSETDSGTAAPAARRKGGS